MEVLLDGESLCEAQAFAQGLAAEGIPALAVSGDSRMLETFGEGELGSAALVTAKEGHGRDAARSRDPATVRAELASAVAAALAAPLVPPPARSYPAELRITVAGEELASTTVSEPARAAGDDRQRLPLEPGLARVPPAGETAAAAWASGAASAASWRRR